MRAYLLSRSPLTSNGGAAMPSRERLDEALEPSRWHTSVDDIEAYQHGLLVSREGDGVAAALALTSAVREALEKAPDDTLVLWDAAPVLHGRASFLDQAQDAAEDDPPIFLWVGFELTEHEDDTRTLTSRGAPALGAAMEIEIERSKRSVEELLERAADAVMVAMTPGVVIEDGDTLELTDDKVRVRIQPSLRGTGERAFRLRVP